MQRSWHRVKSSERKAVQPVRSNFPVIWGHSLVSKFGATNDWMLELTIFMFGGHFKHTISKSFNADRTSWPTPFRNLRREGEFMRLGVTAFTQLFKNLAFCYVETEICFPFRKGGSAPKAVGSPPCCVGPGHSRWLRPSIVMDVFACQMPSLNSSEGM